MGFRLRHSLKIAPSLRINVGKSRVSESIGTRSVCLTISLVVPAVLAVTPAFAQLSKCTDAAGKVTYQNGPCPTGANAEAIIDGQRKSQAEVENAKRQALERKAAREAETKVLQDRLTPADRKVVVMLCADFAKASAKNPASVKFGLLTRT